MLPYEVAKDAMLDALPYFCSAVFRGVNTDEALQDSDGKHFGCPWVNCHKADLDNPDFRCRLVAQDVNHGDGPPMPSMLRRPLLNPSGCCLVNGRLSGSGMVDT